MKDRITKTQLDFYSNNKETLIEKYLSYSPRHIDPDAVRDLFMAIGYDRTNVGKFQGICKVLTKDIFDKVLNNNKGKVRKVIFAAGLPASGKTSHLKKMTENEIVYDGTINDDRKFVKLVQQALDMGFIVEVFIYNVAPVRAFTSNLNRGDKSGRYVPIFQYEKIALSINKRKLVLDAHFPKQVKLRNFEHTRFEGKLSVFSNIIINRNELERIASQHKFPDSKTLSEIIK